MGQPGGRTPPLATCGGGQMILGPPPATCRGGRGLPQGLGVAFEPPLKLFGGGCAPPPEVAARHPFCFIYFY
jgi:hypothetical protein